MNEMTVRQINQLNLSRLLLSDVQYVCARYNLKAVCNDGVLIRFEANWRTEDVK